MLNQGADPLHRDHLGQSALHFVAKEGDEPALDLLLAKGGAASLLFEDYLGRTPIDVARAEGDERRAMLIRLRKALKHLQRNQKAQDVLN